MRRFVLLAAVTLLVAAPAWGQNGTIGLFWDVHGQACTIEIPCFCTARLYVYAYLYGTSAGGITGAEYKIQVGGSSSPDPGWVFTETFAPGLIQIGTGALTPPDNGSRGINVAWAACQQGDAENKILIETVQVVRADCAALPISLEVVKHDRPTNPFFQCPSFTLCDAPVYTQVCVGFNLHLCPNPEPPFPVNATCSTAGRTWINSFSNQDCPEGVADCTVGVEGRAWSQVKALYRD